jgi:hypothetical protein
MYRAICKRHEPYNLLNIVANEHFYNYQQRISNKYESVTALKQ